MSAVERDDDGGPLLVNWAAWRLAKREVMQRARELPAELSIAFFARLEVAPDSFRVREDVVSAAGAPCRRLVVEAEVWLDELLAALRANDLDAIGRFVHGGSFPG